VQDIPLLAEQWWPRSGRGGQFGENSGAPV